MNLNLLAAVVIAILGAYTYHNGSIVGAAIDAGLVLINLLTYWITRRMRGADKRVG